MPQNITLQIAGS